MRYSIIIPTINKCDELLKPCIESILAFTTVNTPDNAEIIVVANGCTDNTREYVLSLREKFHNIELLWRDEPMGYTKAINWGMKVARGEYFVLLNNDTILLNQNYNEWLSILNEPFRRDPNVGISGPMMVPNDGTGLPFLIFFCVMISKGCYYHVGELDEIFSPGYGEDTDYCLRAEKHGFKVVQVPEKSDRYYADKRMVGNFPIYHIGNQTFKDYPDADLIKRNNQILIDRWGLSNNKRMMFVDDDPGYNQKIVDKYVDKDILKDEIWNTDRIEEDGKSLVTKNQEDTKKFLGIHPDSPKGVTIAMAQQCDGYMADEELLWLGRQAQNHRIVIEVGSWHGKSSRALADNLMKDGHLICVDHWLGSEIERDTHHASAKALDGDAAYLEFLENMWDHVGNPHCSTLRLSSKNAAKYLKNHDYKADMIFIDAGHTYEEVLDDIAAWIPLLAEGGMICGHDMFHVNNVWPGVGQAVREIFGEQAKQAPNTSIWMVERSSLPPHVKHYPILKAPIVPIKRPPCIYDCFPFNNEVDILERRFKELYNIVDRFVIVEAKFTHAGVPKELVFNKNLDRFAPFLSKITYLVVEEFEEVNGTVTDKSWDRERFQRNYIMNGLGDCQDDDIIIISDCDEIPYAYAITEFIGRKEEACALEMDLYYYNDHTKARDKWLEAKITTYGNLKKVNPCAIRYTTFPVIHNAGKHLSFFGGVNAVIQKIKDTAHQEYNTDKMKDIDRVADRVFAGKDIFDRSDIQFDRV